MGNEYQYEPEETSVDVDTGEIMKDESHSIIPNVGSLIIEDNHLVINDEYMTEVTPSIMKRLSWSPDKQPMITGTYMGQFTYSWDTERSKGSYKVNIIRSKMEIGDIDTLLPDWSAITNKLAEFDVGTEVAVIYNGLITLKNGHPYHDVTIARKK